jgi:hypothetical protein
MQRMGTSDPIQRISIWFQLVFPIIAPRNWAGLEPAPTPKPTVGGWGHTPVDEIDLGPAYVLDYLSHLPIIPVEGNGRVLNPSMFVSSKFPRSTKKFVIDEVIFQTEFGGDI